MRKKWALSICTATVIAAAGGTGIASASTGTSPYAHAKRQLTFTVYTHMIEAHVITPCRTCATPALPAGSSVGAEWVNDPVFNEKTGGHQIGHEALVLDIVSSDASTALLSAAVKLTVDGLSGELTVSGETDPRSSSGVVAVTGGTGGFEGAKGEVDFSGAGLTSKVDQLTVHLTL